ncbi:hypothetical protein [Lysinibacillus xylanilyticus]|uniref:hypothetical protein n=1 Tax=Lysinibacillus xylanilyticus TaxID=582475 RepID=UPI003D009EC6
MAGEFYFDTDALTRVLHKSVDAIGHGLKNGITDVKNDWQAESVDIAPIDTSNLRKQITAEVFSDGNEAGVEISANSTRGPGVLTSQKTGHRKRNDRRFNYAYYIHEEDAGGKSVNGEKKFLDKPAQQNQEKWAKWIEDEIQSELRKAGW